MKIEEILSQFGLSQKDSAVYLSSLELGTASATRIARKAGIKRTTSYDILEELMERGLIGQTQKGKKRLFYAGEPEELLKLLDRKKEQLMEAMPILKSIYNTAGAKPKIRYYEGIEGLKEVYRDTLSYYGELSAFITENVITKLGQTFVNEYKAKRKRAKISVRVIGPDTPEIIEYKKLDKKDLQQTRLVSQEKFPFSIEMNIYGNKLAFMSFKEEMGVIIESNEIAKNMKLLFELAWKGAGK
ncbi:hypothetical protein KJ885_05890 [Patescibacteria group bacterium]|nr:hypothetical protein [Patescibacteria group bacterium]